MLGVSYTCRPRCCTARLSCLGSHRTPLRRHSRQLPRWLGIQVPQSSLKDGAPVTTPPEPQQDKSVSQDAPASSSDAAPRRRTEASSTDAVSTFLTRRFGLAGGLAWLAVLAVGSLGEQVKTRLEYASEVNNTKDVSNAAEVVTPSGLRYTDIRSGGGISPVNGYLVLVDFVLKADGVVVDDTRARGKPIVFVFGKRPYTGGMCAGTEEALSTMRAGGRRKVVVPAALGFGDSGAVLRPTEHVPDKQGIIKPNSTLEYDLELLRVSIPPS